MKDYIEIDDAISYLDNRDIVFIKNLTFKGKKLLYQFKYLNLLFIIDNEGVL